MKKAITILLALVMVLSLAACGSNSSEGPKSSSISIDSFFTESIKNYIAKDATIAKANTDNGFDFSGSIQLKSLSPDMVFNGKADKNEMLISFEIIATSNHMNIDYFLSDCSLETVLKDIADYKNVPMGKLCIDYLVLYYAGTVFSDANMKAKEEDNITFILNTRNGNQSASGWSYNCAVDKDSSTIKISAEYMG